MKRVKRKITADTDLQPQTELSREARYSNVDVYMLLMSILELQGQPISAVEKEDGSCDFNIGDLTYSITSKGQP